MAAVEPLVQEEEKPKQRPEDAIAATLNVQMHDTAIPEDLLWRAYAVLDYFESLTATVPLYGQLVPKQYAPRHKGRPLTPGSFGAEDEKSAGGGGGGTAKGLRGDEQQKDMARMQKSKGMSNK